MSSKPRHVEIEDGRELLRVAEEVRDSREPVLLTRDGEELAIVRPVPRRSKASPKGTPLTENDPLFGLIGIGRSGIPGGVSGKKHEYLAKAYRKR